MTPIKDPTRLAKLAITATWAFFAMKLFFIGVMAINLIALFGLVPATFPFDAFGRIVRLSVKGNLGFQFVAGALSLAWIYRVSRNAQRLAPGDLPISPAWAVGWYFVPVGAFWKPFEAIEQTWQASVASTAWRSVPTPPLLRWWWSFWLAGGMAGGLLGALRQVGATTQVGTNVALIAISAIVMVQCVLFNRVMGRLTHLQASAVDLGVFD